MLSAGAAVFLAGSAVFRQQLTIGPGSSRVAAALLALAAVPIGAELSATAQIAVLVTLLALLIGVEHRAFGRPGRTPSVKL